MVFKQYASPFAWMCFLSVGLLLSFFSFIDVYHTHFFSTGLTVIIYNASRVAFIFCLLWLFYFTGDCVLAYFANEAYTKEKTLDSTLLAFFSGVGVWQVGMFLLGLMGLDKHNLLLAITLLVFFMSLRTVDRAILLLITKTPSIYWPGWLIVAIVVTFFLLVKGLYPAGGHDYYTHYFHFYQRVIETGRIWPNEVWYHFYYSKGAGLFFLGMLLTDPLAPQLVTSALLAAGAGMLFSLLRNATPWRFFPWLGIALYFAFLIYTPGPDENLRQGGWGDLEKIHEIDGVLMFALLWMMIRLQQARLSRLIGVALLLTIGALVLFTPVMAVFVVGYLLLMWGYLIVAGKRQAANWTLCHLVAAGTLFCIILTINYLFSGLPDDQLIVMFWPYINFTAIKKWGVIFELIFLYNAKVGLAAHTLPVLKSIPLVIKYLRFDVWGVLSCFGLLFFIIGFCQQKMQGKNIPSLLVNALCNILFFLFIAAIFSMMFGRAESISFYRFTTFTYAPTLCLALLMIAVFIRTRLMGTLVFLVMATFSIWQYGSQSHQAMVLRPWVQAGAGNLSMSSLQQIFENSLRFAQGRYSIADAYQNQQGWPGRMPWGGIYPASLEVWKRLPPRTRIWSFHVHSYCMLPDCHMEAFMSYRFSSHPEAVYYGDSQTAKRQLKKESLNYFFISHTLPIKDVLPLTPLFSPTQIAKNFGIVWTDGDNSLITWKEDSHQAIDAKWIKRYQQQVSISDRVKSFPYAQLQVLLHKFKEKGKLSREDIPWAT